MNKIYTKTGDKGQTGLFGGSRTSKSSLQVRAYGMIDELNAALGIVRARLNHVHGRSAELLTEQKLLADLVFVIQKKLFVVGAQLASDDKGRENLNQTAGQFFTRDDAFFLEQVIDQLSTNLENKPYFLVPGDSIISSELHQARAIARRAETHIIMLSEQQFVCGYIMKYINRLSDLLYIMARYIDEIMLPMRNSLPARITNNSTADNAEISLECANNMLSACVNKAKQMQVKMVIAILDKGTNLIALNRMPDALIGSISVAQNKAYTAVAFKMATDELGRLSEQGKVLHSIEHSNDNKIIRFGGGYPIFVNKNLIGAIGVSGGSVEEDMSVAKAALDLFAE